MSGLFRDLPGQDAVVAQLEKAAAAGGGALLAREVVPPGHTPAR